MIDALTEKIRSKSAGKPGFGKAIALDLGADGVIRIDGTGEAVAVTNEPGVADTTVTLAAETLQKLMKGELNAPLAVMTGKIKVAGDASLALKLAKLTG